MKISVVTCRIPNVKYRVCLVLRYVQVILVELNGMILKKCRVQTFHSIYKGIAEGPFISVWERETLFILRVA